MRIVRAEIITQRVKEAEERCGPFRSRTRRKLSGSSSGWKRTSSGSRSLSSSWEQAGVIIQRLGGEIFKTLDDADNQNDSEAIARLRKWKKRNLNVFLREKNAAWRIRHDILFTKFTAM